MYRHNATAADRQSGGTLCGAGVGLRSAHIARVLSERPDVSWFEVLADNHIASGGLIPRQLAAVRADYPIAFHCVGMSLGGTDPLDGEYLRAMSRMIRTFEPVQVSDHLCFTSHASHQYHDLLPLPYTEEALRHVSARVQQVQDILGQRILVENISSYVSYRHATLSEAQFLGALCEEADCDLLLDMNNAYVNEINHGQCAADFFRDLPLQRIREIHLAGYEDCGEYLIDAHNNRVSDPVWDLFADAIAQLPDVPVLIEWDNEIPSLEILLAEAARAEAIRSMRLAAA